MRLWHYWNSKKQGRLFPALDDIAPAEIEDLWPYCFVLKISDSREFPNFHYLGSALAQYSGVFLSGKGNWDRTLLDMAAREFARTIAGRRPVILEDELRRYDGKLLLFRSIMLPLSDDEVDINYVLGAANGVLH